MGSYTHTNRRGDVYHLHGKDVELRGGLRMHIYYFAKTVQPEFSVDVLPAGWFVIENDRTGLPMLKKER